MKKLYRKIKKRLNDLILKLHIYKTWIFEWINIYNKRNIYKNTQLDKAQIVEIEEFWKKNYGKRILTKWHRLYQSYTGNFNVEYFPEILFSTKLEPLLNPRNVCKVLSDKSLLDILYRKEEEVSLPETYIVNCSGIFYDKERNVIDKKRAIELISDIGKCVLKVTVGESSGKGVLMCNFKNGKDIDSGEEIEKIFYRYSQNYII